MTTGYKINSCPPPLLYLSPFQSLSPFPHFQNIYIFFLFTATPIIRNKGTNSLPIYGIPCYFQLPFDVHPPLHVSSQAHSVELSSDPMLGETQEEKCKMCQALPDSLPSSPPFPRAKPIQPSPSGQVWLIFWED